MDITIQESGEGKGLLDILDEKLDLLEADQSAAQVIEYIDTEQPPFVYFEGFDELEPFAQLTSDEAIQIILHHASEE